MRRIKNLFYSADGKAVLVVFLWERRPAATVPWSYRARFASPDRAETALPQWAARFDQHLTQTGPKMNGVR